MLTGHSLIVYPVQLRLHSASGASSVKGTGYAPVAAAQLPVSVLAGMMAVGGAAGWPLMPSMGAMGSVNW
jgi:hypothetical protein